MPTFDAQKFAQVKDDGLEAARAHPVVGLLVDDATRRPSGRWEPPKGNFRILIGGSTRDIRLQGSFRLAKTTLEKLPDFPTKGVLSERK